MRNPVDSETHSDRYCTASGKTRRNTLLMKKNGCHVVFVLWILAAAVAATLVAGAVTSCSSGKNQANPVVLMPQVASINTIQTQTFAATLDGDGNASFTWAVDGIPGGNDSVGTVSSDGLYTPPAAEGTHVVTAISISDPSKSGSANIRVHYLSGTLTYHNDVARTGQNVEETSLTPGNVRTTSFGKLFSYPVDGYVYAQPLYVRDVPMNGQLHDIVVVATEHDSVYAFDADRQTVDPLWHTSFVDDSVGVTRVPSGDVSCMDLIPEIGITGTPVIDPATGTLYVVAKTKENDTYVHRLYALDIRNGSPKPGSGVLIQAGVPGSGDPNDGLGNVLFGPDSLRANQRAALLLANDAVYVAFASFCDVGPYHGWVMAYNATTLALVAAFNDTPDGEAGGIWQSGAGPAADADGNIYVMTANGSFDADFGGTDFGDSILKLRGTTLIISDYFTPYDQSDLSDSDTDLSAGGPVVLPDQSVGPKHLLVGAGKNGTIYLVDRDDMGNFQNGSDSQIVQSLPLAVGTPPINVNLGFASFWGVPAYFQNTLYFAGRGDSLKAFALNNGKLGTAPAAQSANIFPYPGAVPVVSANGSSDGIVWVIDRGAGAGAVLRAYRASDVSDELYNSDQNMPRDNPGLPVKFSVPTVADGKVFVGTQDRLSVFGRLP